MNDLDLLKKIKISSIVSLIFMFTLFLILVTLIIDIVNAIRILSTNWQNKETNDSKIIWGIFTVIILGPIASLIFSVSNIKKYV